MRAHVAGGFTLVEVLAAVLILSIGVIGGAAAQLAALRTRHGSSLMSSGVQLAGGLADRMRANAAQMQAADADNPYLTLNYDAASGAPPSAPVPCFGAAACSSVQMAQFDLAEVRQAVHAGFPGGRVAVCRDSAIVGADSALVWDCAGAPGAPFVIKLGWRGKRADGASEGQSAGPALAVVVDGGAG